MKIVRTTDPETSHEAAAQFRGEKMTRHQRWVLGVFQEFPKEAMTDEVVHRRLGWRGKKISPSSVRTRRRELQEQGLVEFAGEYGETEMGNRARKHRLSHG